MPSAEFDVVTDLAARSAVARYPWKDRGRAPPGYVKGMALVYARVLCKLKSGDAAAADMARESSGDRARDALAWYDEKFRALGMRNDVSGPDTLRHLFVLLIGLGMRESSGRHCVGRDRSAENTRSDTAEAGLFQTSYNARTASPLMPQLFEKYSANPLGFLDIFREGVRCSANDLENYGSGPGKQFQRLSKECPAFGAEFCAIGLRHRRRHWGPINRREAEVLTDTDAMLMDVQRLVESSRAVCAAVAMNAR